MPRVYPNPNIVLSTPRTNLITNPSAETNTTNAPINGAGTVTRDATWAKYGSWSFKLVTTGVNSYDGILWNGTTRTACVPGDVISVGNWGYAPTLPGAGLRWTIGTSFFNSGGGYIGGGTAVVSQVTTAGVPVELKSENYTVPATIGGQVPAFVAMYVTQGNTAGGAVAATSYFDGAMMVKAATVGAYVDGSRDNAGWDGTAHNSTSTSGTSFNTTRKPEGPYKKILQSKGAFDVAENWEAELLESSGYFDSDLLPGPTNHWRYMAEVLADNPILYWKLYETPQADFGVAADSSGNPGTGGLGYRGQTYQTTEQGGTAVTADGGPTMGFFNPGAFNQVYSNIDGTPEAVFVANQPRTMEAWVYRLQNAGSEMIFGGGNGNNQNGFYVHFVGASRSIVVAPFGNGGSLSTHTNAMPATTYGLNEWTHLAVAWDGTGAAGNTKVWVNGLPISTIANWSTAPFGSTSNDVLRFGVWYYGTPATSLWAFNGVAAHYAVYGSVLSDARIAAHYASRGTPPVVTNTYATGTYAGATYG